MSKFNKLLLSELRVIESESNVSTKMIESADELYEALVDNENLSALGYTLKEDAILRLAAEYEENPSMTPLYKRVMALDLSIEVDPMYPNFPTQVLEMADHEYRADQAFHYLTTYGLESLLGVKVERGWLPETTDVAEREVDELVVDLKTLDYLGESEVDELVINSLIGKRERLLPGEFEIAKTVALRTDLEITNVPFKENIGAIFGELLLTGDLDTRYKTLEVLSGVVKHPGDVLDLVEFMVVKNKYKHFKTSVKRGLVELIEQFSDGAIEENLASNRWSNKFLGKGGKARAINRNISLIDFLSYNRFSKKDSAKKLVAELKSGLLKSWNQMLEKAYEEEDFDEVLELLAQRPGVMFRQVNRLVKLGVEPDVISGVLKSSAGNLKTQTIVSALNNYEGSEEVEKIFLDVLVNNINDKDLAKVFEDKKIYIEEGNVDFEMSSIEITDKFEDGGYVTNGVAIKIPEDSKFLRFFTYWNDKKTIDIDLHTVAVQSDGNISHVGWNGNFRDDVLVYSGDITHSDATEYIDLDLEGMRRLNVDKVQFNINSYTGIPFNRIETIFTGLMGISEMRAEVDLFDPKNVIFRHDLNNKSMAVDYAIIDVKTNTMKIVGKQSDSYNNTNVGEISEPALSMKRMIGLLVLTQGGTIVANEDEADLVLGLAKEDKENYVSLIDENFFMDAE